MVQVCFEHFVDQEFKIVASCEMSTAPPVGAKITKVSNHPDVAGETYIVTDVEFMVYEGDDQSRKVVCAVRRL